MPQMAPVDQVVDPTLLEAELRPLTAQLQEAQVLELAHSPKHLAHQPLHEVPAMLALEPRLKLLQHHSLLPRHLSLEEILLVRVQHHEQPMVSRTLTCLLPSTILMAW